MIRYDFTGKLYGFTSFLNYCPGRIIYICLLSLVCFFPFPLSAQENIKISQPTLRFLNDRLMIKYEILGYQPDDRFKVWLEITDSTGNRIDAHAIYGDIGDEVAGGPLKQIIWDLAADSMYLNMDLSVEVFATRNIKPVPVVAIAAVATHEEIKTDTALTKKSEEQPAELKNDTEVTENKEKEVSETKTETAVTEKKTEPEPQPKADAESTATKKSTSEKKEKKPADKSMQVGSNLLLSTACPGWGLTRLSGGKPYWLIGVAGFACIGSSVYLNKVSHSNYEKYLESSDINKTDEMDAYYNTGKKQYTASSVLAYSAITIWVADLGLTWFLTSKMQRSAAHSKSGSFSVGSSFDYYADTPMISIFYTF
jgi:hypothetical protein